MGKERIQLTEDMVIETYPFSDYITCIEVFVNGQSFNSFCSDNELVEEWKENPDQLIQLCKGHLLTNTQRSSVTPVHNRKQLQDGVEFEMYSFSEDVYCVNVYKMDKMVTSFCSDRLSMQEWEEEPAALESIIKTLIK